ncbi:hypothetical protein G4B88_026739 [Cannabis sativa]|uniref:KIB1-4 beta-propeller domain-containing protein n=1 Tax=Cannabis sativa TaxID=3483 RepID=A0A7J6F970_CANSA|nr:hypothetical protein G4B88_026739 [Cannabis sativa]
MQARSSNGWLVVLNKPKKGSFILNPFTKKKLHIPNVGTSLTCTIISKAIVVSSKKKQGNDNDNNTNWVVVIYGYVQQKLACCKVGGDDDCSWNDLKDSAYPNMSFCDILSHKNHLFGLSNSNHVHIWDFSHNGSNIPTKLIPLVPKSQPCFDLLKSEKFKKESYFCQSYLVESMSGELLLVTRVVGYIVNSDGELLEEADLYDGLICPYSTVAICVHKMKMKMKRETEKLEFEWENVESLGCDEAVFVGRSESMCCSTEFVPGYKGNSIYFSDDNWDMMDIDYSFGGHDNGVYSMETKTVVKVEPWFDQIQAEKIYPPPLAKETNPRKLNSSIDIGIIEIVFEGVEEVGVGELVLSDDTVA